MRGIPVIMPAPSLLEQVEQAEQELAAAQLAAQKAEAKLATLKAVMRAQGTDAPAPLPAAVPPIPGRSFMRRLRPSTSSKSQTTAAAKSNGSTHGAAPRGSPIVDPSICGSSLSSTASNGGKKVTLSGTVDGGEQLRSGGHHSCEDGAVRSISSRASGDKDAETLTGMSFMIPPPEGHVPRIRKMAKHDSVMARVREADAAQPKEPQEASTDQTCTIS